MTLHRNRYVAKRVEHFVRLPVSVAISIFVAIFLVSASEFAWQKDQTKPEESVRAFAKALAKDDFPAMARLVIGGKPNFDFSKLRGDDQQLDTVYVQFDVKVKEVKVVGDRATVIVGYTAKEKGDEYAGTSEKEIVPLQLVDGQWLIVPYTKLRPTGYFMERLANILANPEEELAKLTKAYGPTRNVGLDNIKLGLQRRDFFAAILKTDGPERNYVPYNGYKSMTMVEHTSVMWPVGKADEVVFDMGLEQGSYLTYWKKVNGKPKRIFQYEIKDGDGKQSPIGTLETMLAKNKSRLGKGQGASPTELIRKKQVYACYIEVGAIGSFVCTVLREDGTRDPSTPNYSMEAIMQDSYQLFKRGFFITPAEEMLIANGQGQ